MIRDMDTFNSLVPTAKQGNTKETRPGKPDDVAQKHDITSHLKTDGNAIQQQTVDFSSRTVTDLNSGINNSDTSPLPKPREADAKVGSKTETGQKVAHKRSAQEVNERFDPTVPEKRKTFKMTLHNQSVSETSEHIGQDKRPTQQNTPLTPYPDTSGYRRVFALMDNNTRRNYCARHANVPASVERETVRIGKQNLMTLDTSQSLVDRDLESDMSNWRCFAGMSIVRLSIPQKWQARRRKTPNFQIGTVIPEELELN
ncbi:hypothetical protein [Endozoicomonas sp. 8E]|uniref:hypothetical protein n=1 Tax=Endozoicomonas sp. 8E TaxID=3035692 RepID=UPI002938E7E2|nr:hypothetical protein [Endozoicomonas sp. 8E]WOG30034.1 hypothetical protein P6910_10380 [Endozoicomonas sp. 8E]